MGVYITGTMGEYRVKLDVLTLDLTIERNDPPDRPSGINAQLNKDGFYDASGHRYPPGKPSKAAFDAELSRVHQVIVDAVIHSNPVAQAELNRLSGPHVDGAGNAIPYAVGKLANWYAADIGHRQQGFRLLYKPSGMPTIKGGMTAVIFMTADVHPPGNVK